MPVETKSKTRELVAILVTSAAMLGIYAIIQSTWVQDWWKGLNYDESSSISAIREDLELTDTAKHIFLATQPALEGAEEFNEHCDSHRADISLLGCYTGDKMYIYAVDLPELKDSNKVTAAHELLHATWARMGKSERAEVEKLLRDFQAENPDWAEAELNLYNDSQKLEELYTRIGTKLREIPAELEAHYRRYFQDRQKIVEFYESYQTPFNELLEENKALQAKVAKLNQELESERAGYFERLEKLEAEIEKFNQCADTEGCFRSTAEFQQRRNYLETERNILSTIRTEINQKIDENNAAVAKYEENLKKLGKLNAALNSNLEEKI